MSEITRLRSLASDKNAQAGLALTLIKPRQARDVLLAALAVLTETPQPQARPDLLQLYAHYAANGPRRDPAAYLRRALLDALRTITLLADLPLLLEAVTTYEYIPDEQAQVLRASALLALNHLDDELAVYHAARLLVDTANGHTSLMSGEPALTAVRVLASQNQMLPLFMMVMQHNPTLPDVIAECLRSLTALPVALIPALVGHIASNKASMVQVGLFDLLIQHRAGPQALELMDAALLKPDDLDVYRYLVIAMLSSQQPRLRDIVLRRAATVSNHQQRAVLLQALAPFAADREVCELIVEMTG
jgi:hypothetical protein